MGFCRPANSISGFHLSIQFPRFYIRAYSIHLCLGHPLFRTFNTDISDFQVFIFFHLSCMHAHTIAAFSLFHQYTYCLSLETSCLLLSFNLMSWLYLSIITSVEPDQPSRCRVIVQYRLVWFNALTWTKSYIKTRGTSIEDTGQNVVSHFSTNLLTSSHDFI